MVLIFTSDGSEHPVTKRSERLYDDVRHEVGIGSGYCKDLLTLTDIVSTSAMASWKGVVRMPSRKNERDVKPYTTIDHTADIGIRVFGKNGAELFGHAGMALFEQITETRRFVPENQIDLTVSGRDWPDLMVNWLRELLYLWTGLDLLVVGVRIDKIEAFRLRATVDTVRYIPETHRILQEIKAVTYHGLDVRKTDSGWEATVIFDI